MAEKEVTLVPTPVGENPLSRMERITILFKEYETLRSEIIARTAAGYQFVGAGVVLFVAWITSRQTGHLYNPLLTRSLFAAFLITITGAVAVAFIGIERPHRHIAQLEHKINELAGEKFLTWEGSLYFLGLRERKPKTEVR